MPKKLTITKVQDAFNKAIRERDGYCINHAVSPCSGNLECSHFYAVGGNGGLRFHPDNAHAQCTRHHFDHHQRDPLIYVEWMQWHKPEQTEKLQAMRHHVIKYNQSTLRQIYDYCKAGQLDELRDFIEELHKK